MKHLIAISIGLVWGGAALAADPVRTRPHATPAATFRTVAATDVTQPLPAAVSTALPPPGMGYPLSHGPMACAGEGCPGGTCGTYETDSRTCLEKLTDWFCFRPGPRVLPLCTPVPYHAPLRHYFPCHPGQCLVVGGCNPASGCGAGGCGHPGRIGLLAPAAAGYGYTAQAAPVPAGTIPGQPTVRMARPTFRDRVMGVFESAWPAPTPTVAFPTQGVATGPTVVPAPTGHRFATPGAQQPTNGVQGGMMQTGHRQPAVNRPLTKQ